MREIKLKKNLVNSGYFVCLCIYFGHIPYMVCKLKVVPLYIYSLIVLYQSQKNIIHMGGYVLSDYRGKLYWFPSCFNDRKENSARRMIKCVKKCKEKFCSR